MSLLVLGAVLGAVVLLSGGYSTEATKQHYWITHRILDIVPAELHQRTPLVIGSRSDVGFVADVLREVMARPSGGVAATAP